MIDLENHKKTGDRVVDLNIYVIYDIKTGQYRMPGYAVNDLDFVRQIERIMRDPQSQTSELVANSEDFVAYHVGDFDRRTGDITITNRRHVLDFGPFCLQVKQRAEAAQ